MARRADGERKRAHIYETALALFREKGFDEATMREIAKAAGVSVGNAYHYFPSKQAIVFAYYDEQQARHEKLAEKRLERTEDLRDRLGIVFQTKLETLRKDRRLLIAIARSLPDLDDPLSAFSKESQEIRERAIALFRLALRGTPIREAHHELAAKLLWSLHLVSLLYLVHDDSPGQTRTKNLVDGFLDMVTPMLMMAETPGFEPVWERAAELLRDAKLE